MSASNNGVNRQAKAENPLLKWRLVTRLLGLPQLGFGSQDSDYGRWDKNGPILE